MNLTRNMHSRSVLSPFLVLNDQSAPPPTLYPNSGVYPEKTSGLKYNFSSELLVESFLTIFPEGKQKNAQIT